MGEGGECRDAEFAKQRGEAADGQQVCMQRLLAWKPSGNDVYSTGPAAVTPRGCISSESGRHSGASDFAVLGSR